MISCCNEYKRDDESGGYGRCCALYNCRTDEPKRKYSCKATAQSMINAVL
jgi:hypothetical protein